MAERASHLPSTPSGGQRQRVAIARALVNEPAVVLADESTGNLDSAATLEVLWLFGAMHAEGLTLVVVTHDERVAATADRLISMRDGAFVKDTGLASTGGPDIHFPAGLDATWEQVRRPDEKELTVVQIVLVAGSWLLGMLAIAIAIAIVAVLVGGRMAEQARRAGLIKAAGGTPQFVAVLLLAENLLLALAATIIGLAVGYLVAPLLASPSLSLLGSANSPSLTTSKAFIAVAVAVAVAATVIPAVRAARSSTIGALNDPARTLRRHAAMIALSARLSASLVLGLLLAIPPTPRSA